MLNRDIQNLELNIYDIESSQTLQGSLDMGLLSESGRDQIAENLMQSGMIVNTINLIATNNTVGISEFFTETDKSYQTYQGIKETIAKDPELAKALQNPSLNPEQKKQMLNQVANAVMVKLGYSAYETQLIDTDQTGRDDQTIKGFYSTQTNQAYINDQNNNSTEELITIAGHEATRAMDDQNKVNFDENREERSEYAQNFGENLANYTNMALTINGYDQGMASENNRTGNDTSPLIEQNNDVFRTLDKDKGDNNPLIIAPLLIALTASESANAPAEGEEPIDKVTWPQDEVIQYGVEKASALTGVSEDVLNTAMNMNPMSLIKNGVTTVSKVVDGGSNKGKGGIIREGDVKVFDVGPYNQIKGTVPGLDAHHAGQKAVMKKFVSEYDLNTAPAILVPKVGHTIKGPNGIVSRNTNGIDSARELLARDIKELRRVYPEVSNSQLKALIDLNKKMYSSEFTK